MTRLLPDVGQERPRASCFLLVASWVLNQASRVLSREQLLLTLLGRQHQLLCYLGLEFHASYWVQNRDAGAS